MTVTSVYGIHAVEKFLLHTAEEAVELFVAESQNQRLRSVAARAGKLGIPVRTVTRAELDRMCAQGRHQGCVLGIRVGAGPAKRLEQCLAGISDSSLFLVLDGVQDPHNLGACLRSADATGVDAVIIPKDRSVKLNATVRKVAAGAAESVPLIEVTNLARSLRQLKQAGVWIYGTSGDASETIYDFDYRGPVALVMGSEGEGLRRLTAEQCDRLVKLPMLGVIESLNVSVATGICLYEVLRSRLAKR